MNDHELAAHAALLAAARAANEAAAQMLLPHLQALDGRIVAANPYHAIGSVCVLYADGWAVTIHATAFGFAYWAQRMDGGLSGPVVATPLAAYAALLDAEAAAAGEVSGG